MVASRGLTHVNEQGAVRMVSVGDKPVTDRGAVARARVVVTADVIDVLRRGELRKGDALAVARIAAISAVKKTPDLIPLCHPLAITGVDVTVSLGDGCVELEASVRTADRTGIEMEALTAVTVGALNIIDMVKALDRGAFLEWARIERKEGGASGQWVRDAHGQMLREEPGESTTSEARDACVTPDEPFGYVLTVSDRAAAGARVDETGPMIVEAASQWGSQCMHEVVPDDAVMIRDRVRAAVRQGAWFVVTTGGTGITSRDVTPDAVAPLLDKPLPALAHQLQVSGVGRAPGALLSRSVAGISEGALVVTLPGSVGAVRDGLEVLGPMMGHVREQLADGDHERGEAHDDG
ncbi:bifunctional molybdenum cofactor biosynthesis protein MoaC/MoaB [Jonesia denitrificans]|uniref:cyclic pyranopterin monophosphate synthase n=1 Tax=Jonesia denitrificans (strain ATCC 14870 / DSM 20603 / BCRC 15368 / CIP 55.134 / JCM 11481 / NBRC 15587 / NCTC 10816 / Prevot 55134) TaxID=471856 RepID=C7R439_JONDD|nr:bifunctional molybdenum cofactor biosynthesis protein MoaC/MoaB [Jonesia denitrificans]ACV08896.1 molybdenum cofactor biosynthesis protein C [Jonesia denitrificans DSM 20603]ASE09791.1 bifunctional molybdenum cofactor biosynthesis protein MoaC/MoaB [Jonesia denitrificans]QXB44328.1 bifunctional molybdenum cofactor biosynthesis protein MoaC/MoaB [Jonesia denitrificans]SQH20937.1 Molybdenum cofactor biosynthesis protein C [Jonesia denitrificans]